MTERPTGRLRAKANRDLAILNDGGYAAGDGEHYDPGVILALLDMVEAVGEFYGAGTEDEGQRAEYALEDAYERVIALLADEEPS